MDKRTTLLGLLVTGALVATGCSVEKPSDDAGPARACGAALVLAKPVTPASLRLALSDGMRAALPA